MGLYIGRVVTGRDFLDRTGPRAYMLWDGFMDRVVTGWGNLYKVLWGDGSIGNAGTVGMQVVTESQIFGITDKTPNEKTPNDKTPNEKTTKCLKIQQKINATKCLPDKMLKRQNA